MRVIFDQTYSGDKHYQQIAGPSTESKPTSGLVTGSLYLEVDTMKLYAFNEANNGSWGDGVKIGSDS